MTTKKKSESVRFLEGLVGPLTFGKMLRSIRECDEMSQADMAKRLSISRSHLCDIEKDRKSVSPKRAAAFGRILGYGEKQFVQLALQAQLDQAGLEYMVQVA